MCCLVSGKKLNFYVYLFFTVMFIQCECVACLLNVSTAFCLLGVRNLLVLFKTQAFNFLTRTLPTFSSHMSPSKRTSDAALVQGKEIVVTSLLFKGRNKVLAITVPVLAEQPRQSV